MSDVPRAALVPIGSRLRGLDRSFSARAAAVSLGEPEATHLFLVGEPLPPELAASAAGAGRLFFGGPEARAFAEGGEAPPEAEDGCYRLRLRGVGPVLRIPEAALRPLGERVEVTWAEEAAAPRPRPLPVVSVTLAVLAEPRPVTGLIVSPREAVDLEETLFAFPEERFAGTRFLASRSGIYVTARSPEPLAGLRGEAFHGADLGRDCVLHLPLGRGVREPAAWSFLSGRLAVVEGRVCFWRDEGRIEVLRGADLAPLTRRAWRARGGP